MARQLFRSCPSLHHIIDRAPFEQIEQLLRCDPFTDLPVRVPEPEDPTSFPDLRRAQVLNPLSGLSAEAVLPPEREAARICALADAKGGKALEGLVASRYDPREAQVFHAQPDALSRSIWAYLHARRLFDAAESVVHLRLYRDYSKLYDAFELVDCVPLDPNAIDVERLGLAVSSSLGLGSTCTVSIFEMPRTGDEPKAMLLLIQHPGSLSSVQDLPDSGQRRTLYYRPPNEAAVVYTPATGVIEVCATSPTVRRVVADTVAATTLGQDLSQKPLTWRRYDLARFHGSLCLPVPVIAGYEIARISVTEVEAGLGSWRRRLSLKVTIDDDIEAVAQQHLGMRHVFRRATILLVQIAVRFARSGDKQSKTLSFTVTDRNRCSLLSNRDPDQRALGSRLLDHWGILKAFRPMEPHQERALIPVLLELHDLPDEAVTGAFFEAWGLDTGRLIEAAFIERRGRDNIILIDDDDLGLVETTVEPSGVEGVVQLSSGEGQEGPRRPAEEVERFAVNRPWLEETLQKHVKPLIRTPMLQQLDDCLTFFGLLHLGDEDVPCYLARRLWDTKVLNRLDVLLRGRAMQGLGVVLSAGETDIEVLGSNVVVPAARCLASLNGEEPALSAERLALAYAAGRPLARGGTTVSLAKNGSHSATLYLPGKTPWTITGANQIRIVERLVEAYQRGTPAVPSKSLIEGTAVTSPRQAFRSQSWDSINGVYIGQAGKRGSWQLLA